MQWSDDVLNVELVRKKALAWIVKAVLIIFIFIVIPVVILANIHPFILNFNENVNLISYKTDYIIWELSNFVDIISEFERELSGDYFSSWSYEKELESRYSNKSLEEFHKIRKRDTKIVKIALKLYHKKYKEYPKTMEKEITLNDEGEIVKKLEKFVNPLPRGYIAIKYYSDGINYAIWTKYQDSNYSATNNESWMDTLSYLKE